MVDTIVTDGDAKGTITCKVHSNTNSWIDSIDEGFFDLTNIGLTTSLGTINWGRYMVQVVVLMFNVQLILFQ